MEPQPPKAILRLFTVGFLAGIALAFVCFGAAASYLFSFLNRTSTSMQDLLGMASSQSGASFHDLVMLSMNTQMVSNKMALLSCGVFSGMAFGFLGFALFLIGARGNVELQAKEGDKEIRMTNLAPGLFVILCAAVMIVFSVTQKFETSFEKVPGGTAEPATNFGEFHSEPLGGDLDSIPALQDPSEEVTDHD
jgi:hypothetical protein